MFYSFEQSVAFSITQKLLPFCSQSETTEYGERDKMLMVLFNSWWTESFTATKDQYSHITGWDEKTETNKTNRVTGLQWANVVFFHNSMSW